MKTPVTVLGLGAMGTALARAFLAAGHPTTVWNRTPGRSPELDTLGATRAATAAEAVAASPLVVVCLLVDATVRSTLDGLDLTGRTVANLTNGTPAQARDTADLGRCARSVVPGRRNHGRARDDRRTGRLHLLQRRPGRLRAAPGRPRRDGPARVRRQRPGAGRVARHRPAQRDVRHVRRRPARAGPGRQREGLRGAVHRGLPAALADGDARQPAADRQGSRRRSRAGCGRFEPRDAGGCLRQPDRHLGRPGRRSRPARPDG